MNTEKSLIIYFSNSGYTKKLANELSRNISCDIEEIKTAVSYSGFFGYQRAMFHAIFGKVPETEYQIPKKRATHEQQTLH